MIFFTPKEIKKEKQRFIASPIILFNGWCKHANPYLSSKPMHSNPSSGNTELVSMQSLSITPDAQPNISPPTLASYNESSCYYAVSYDNNTYASPTRLTSSSTHQQPNESTTITLAAT